mgnify:CR=1 FL=1|tara:strand:+ start:23125 stop:24306 length:1182 start_codon:yes stop_codon:yes gene_type:complete
MKTLKQIILDESAAGNAYSTMNAKQFEKYLKNNELELLQVFNGREDLYQVYIFTPPKQGKMKDGDKKLFPVNYPKMDNLKNLRIDFGIAFDLTTRLNDPTLSNIALVEPYKGKKWLVIILKKDFVDNITALSSKFRSDTKLPSSGKFTYYGLDAIKNAVKDLRSSEKEKQVKADAIEKNNKKWMEWIPFSAVDVKLDAYKPIVNKIRQLVGLPEGSDLFDKDLETVLKAWQKKRKIPVTGVWDDASETAAEKLLTTDGFYVSYADYEEGERVITALSKEEIKKALGTEEPEPEETETITNNEDAMPFRNVTEINSFRNWVRMNTDFNQDRTGDSILDATGDMSVVVEAAWAEHGEAYMNDKENGYKQEDPPEAVTEPEDGEKNNKKKRKNDRG